MVFEGPSADRCREQMRSSSSRCRTGAYRLQDLAALLERAASAVEEAQLEAKRRAEERAWHLEQIWGAGR